MHPPCARSLKANCHRPEPALEVPVLTGDPTYENYIGTLFTVNCTGCHTEGDAAPEGLDLSTYAATMKGGDNGAVIVPGDANSILIQIQSAEHFANFTIEELNNVIQWIVAGAPEK